MTRADRDAEFTEYVTARLPSLRRVAYLLCADWAQADDLAQQAITKLYVHWGRVRAADDVDAYARAVLVREFLGERRSGWVQQVCAAHADGLMIFISTYGRHPALDAVAIFRHHLRLLGPKPSYWTTWPLT